MVVASPGLSDLPGRPLLVGGHMLGTCGPFRPGPSLEGINVRKLGTEENNLRCVVDPNEKDDQGGGCAIRRLQPFHTNVPSDSHLAGLEQNGGHKCAGPNILPLYGGIGEKLEKHSEQKRKHYQRQHQINAVPENPFAC